MTNNYFKVIMYIQKGDIITSKKGILQKGNNIYFNCHKLKYLKDTFFEIQGKKEILTNIKEE